MIKKEVRRILKGISRVLKPYIEYEGKLAQVKNEWLREY